MVHLTRVRPLASTAALVLAAVACAGSSAPQWHGMAITTGPAVTTAATQRALAGTDASNAVDLGGNGWRVQSSAVATQPGAQISSPSFDASSWLAVANDDGGGPGTEVEALAQNGQCPGDTALQPVNQSQAGASSIYFSSNLARCYGTQNGIGAESVSRFAVPWWWRTTFTATPASNQSATLIVNGVVGAADVWVNGQQVASSSTVTGAYTRFAFAITPRLASGTNVVAIEVHPNDPSSMFTLDNVDWSQIPPDNNTGIEFPVQLEIDGPLSDGNAYVTQADSAGLSSAALTVHTDITNHTASSQAGTVNVTITPPGGGGAVTVSQNVTVAASSTQTVTFTPGAFPSLTLASPQVWWPYQMGGQPLYTLATSVAQNGTTLNSTSGTFGIRSVTSSLVGSSSAMPSGARAFKINGVPLVIRGGGWSPNLLLHYSAADTARQIALIKSMGLNTIRLEGHFMPADFYQQLDRAGILVNAGFQCCDAWQLQDSGLTSSADFAVMSLSALALGQTMRDDPSVFSFEWSDDAPTAQQETDTLNAFSQAGFTAPVISSAEYNSSPKLGVSGEKEGPYNWVPPNYFYDTSHSANGDSTQTNVGGAWGFDSEESAGDTIPTMDSLGRFMSAADLATLWQNTNATQFHLNYESGCSTGYDFGTLCKFDTSLSKRYGTWTSLSQYVQEAQAQEYEDTQAQFEAFLDHANSSPLPATGTIYWQMNKGWPSLLWTLYGSDGDQAGSFFGAQEANRPVHALYALSNGTVTLDNLTNASQSGLSVEAKVYSLAGTVLDDQTASNITLASQQVRTGVLTPKVAAATSAPTAPQVYFVELQLSRGGTVIDRNVYWQSTQKDVVNWGSTAGQPAATMTQRANLQALRTLAKATVSVTASSSSQPGPGGADTATTVTLTNTSSVPAFLLRADVRRGTASGQAQAGDSELQSATWDGNDITLFPGESQTLTVRYASADLNGAQPVVTVSGWNTSGSTVTAKAK